MAMLKPGPARGGLGGTLHPGLWGPGRAYKFSRTRLDGLDRSL